MGFLQGYRNSGNLKFRGGFGSGPSLGIEFCHLVQQVCKLTSGGTLIVSFVRWPGLPLTTTNARVEGAKGVRVQCFRSSLRMCAPVRAHPEYRGGCCVTKRRTMAQRSPVAVFVPMFPPTAPRAHTHSSQPKRSGVIHPAVGARKHTTAPSSARTISAVRCKHPRTYLDVSCAFALLMHALCFAVDKSACKRSVCCVWG